MRPLLVVLALIAVAVVAWLGYANYTVIRDYQAGQRLARSGVVAQARVLSAEQVNPGRSPSYRVRLSFMPQDGAGSIVTIDRRVDFATYATLRDQPSAQVRYLPGQPQTAQVVGSAETGNTAWLVILLDVMVLGFVVWGVWTWRQGK